MFEKWLFVILIILLPPLVPPWKEGKLRENLVPSPMHRGGLGWGKKYLIHQS
jgi:hypothetical protein